MSAQQTTISPVAIEATIRSFNLTPAEQAEVEAVKLSLAKLTQSKSRSLEVTARTTANAGVQCLLLNQPSFVRTIVNNEYLDRRAILPFLERIAGTKRGRLLPTEVHAVRALLSHKTVVSDVHLFKRAWEAAILASPWVTSPSTTVVNTFSYFCEALNLHSVSTRSSGNEMSIETLMLILEYINRQEERYGIDYTVDGVRANALAARDTEIKAWIQKNMPDYVDLPLSWVLKVYDLYKVA